MNVAEASGVKPEPDTSERILYGRRRGKRLRPGRQALLSRLLPRIAVSPPAAGRLDPGACFGPAVRDVWLEIGFGGGEHLAAQARARPDIGMIGCEPFVNGVASLLSIIEREGLENVRIFAEDGRVLLDCLADSVIGNMFVLFPDPWPKKRHHKRRLINSANLDLCARVLRLGAELRIATDHAGYCRWILEHLTRHQAFEWLATGPDDWRQRPSDWPPTRYEAKARAQGARPVFLRFRRVATA